MPSKLNLNALMIAIEKPVDRACRQLAIQLAEEKVDEAKQAFLEEFLTDEVTQEIDAGEHGEGGVLPSEAQGNLFSFLGFEAGSKPIEDLYNYLDQNIYLNKVPRLDRTNNEYIFQVNIPSKDDIKAVTPMPWNTGASWAYGIEMGIAGLNYYLSIQKANAYDEATGRKRQREEFSSDISRSTTAIQSKNLVNPGIGAFTARKYMSSLMNDLKRLLTS